MCDRDYIAGEAQISQIVRYWLNYALKPILFIVVSSLIPGLIFIQIAAGITGYVMRNQVGTLHYLAINININIKYYIILSKYIGRNRGHVHCVPYSNQFWIAPLGPGLVFVWIMSAEERLLYGAPLWWAKKLVLFSSLNF